jgi:hypothetical protein
MLADGGMIGHKIIAIFAPATASRVRFAHRRFVGQSRIREFQ